MRLSAAPGPQRKRSRGRGGFTGLGGSRRRRSESGLRFTTRRRMSSTRLSWWSYTHLGPVSSFSGLIHAKHGRRDAFPNVDRSSPRLASRDDPCQTPVFDPTAPDALAGLRLAAAFPSRGAEASPPGAGGADRRSGRTRRFGLSGEEARNEAASPPGGEAEDKICDNAAVEGHFIFTL
ncbi:Hypothetical protein SMAX5B_016408 [Scophthalmus maximus]|uniref:Uncharacterized protein n=1 Tax=Scophthalmus maximus TaxID=52904 RepID=A0A2U9C0W5_SCOMX|nr:Hypothetical protein SMAX5B_016408 [Scophthalmus maximus]